MKIIISESQYSRLKSYNTPSINFLINETAGKKVKPLSEAWYNLLGDIVGVFDPTGIVDTANAISYWSQGRKTFALLSLISAIPGLDFIAKPFMVGGKIVGGASKLPLLGWLVKTLSKWIGKVLDKIDKLLLSRIPIVKNFANGIRSFVTGLRNNSGININESKIGNLLKENVDFNELYNRLFPKIYKSVCLKYSDGDRERAQDFCQDGFIKAYNKLDQFRGENIDGWVAQIVRNNILDELRKENRRFKTTSADFGRLDAGEEDYEDLFMGRFSEKDIQDAISNLSPKYQDVFRAYYFDDMTHDEIAKKYGLSPGTSKSNLFKAKANVKKYLENLKET